jgi:hypothetical protein
MRNPLTLAAIALTIAIPAAAELHIQVNTTDPLTGLPPDQWIVLMTTEVNARPLIGKEEVFMLNATGTDLVANCGKWSLVGSHPYIDGNPTVLPPFSVTHVPTKGFDGYCKDGVKGLSPTGAAYNGRLNAADGSFTNSTFVIFSAATRIQ